MQRRSISCCSVARCTPGRQSDRHSHSCAREYIENDKLNGYIINSTYAIWNHRPNGSVASDEREWQKWRTLWELPWRPLVAAGHLMQKCTTEIWYNIFALFSILYTFWYGLVWSWCVWVRVDSCILHTRHTHSRHASIYCICIILWIRKINGIAFCSWNKHFMVIIRYW